MKRTLLQRVSLHRILFTEALYITDLDITFKSVTLYFYSVKSIIPVY